MQNEEKENWPIYGKEEILRLRKRMGMNKTEFATFFHFQKSIVTNWESGARIPSSQTNMLFHIVDGMLETRPIKKGETFKDYIYH